MQKQTIILLAFILLLSALLGFGVLTRGHIWGDDFAAYIMQAISIYNGDMDHFLMGNTFAVTQSSHQIGPAAYPWGFPLMLVPVYVMFGLSPLALKLTVVLSYCCFLIAFFFLMKRRFSTTECLFAVSIFAFNPELLLFLDNILSDIPFLFFSICAIVVVDKYIQEKDPNCRLILAILSGLLLFGAYFIRTQGVILLGSLLLFQGLRFFRERSQWLQFLRDSLIILTVFLLFWFISSLIFPGGQTSYFALYNGFSVDVLRWNINSYSNLFAEFYASLPGQRIFFGIFVAFFLIGLVTNFKEDLFFIIYSILYLAVLWSWPEWQGYRFIFPLLPFFQFFAFRGIQFIMTKFPKTVLQGMKTLVYTMLAFFCATFIFTSTDNALENLNTGRQINGPFDPVSKETYEFIKMETAPDDILIFFKPRAIRLMTERIALASTECERMYLGDYLVLSKKVGENLQIPPERISECNLPLERVFQNRRFIVYELMD